MTTLKLIESDAIELETITRNWYQVESVSEGSVLKVGETFAVCSNGTVLDVDGVPIDDTTVADAMRDAAGPPSGRTKNNER